MKWSWFPRIEAITPGTAAVRRCRCVSSRFGASFGISLGGLACKKRARDFSYHLFLSNSLGTLVNGIGDERHLYRSNWRAAFPVLSVLHLGGSENLLPVAQRLRRASEGGELNYLSPKEQTGFISVKLTTQNQARFGGFPSDSGGNALFLLK